MTNVKDSIWFTQLGNPGTIGIVHVEDPYDGDLFYIGTGDGVDKLDDERHISATGAKFPKESGAKLFGR